ncbi:MAG: hypothetical protein JXR10_18160 [Cyclobacteriaceae bacterium]
MDFPKLLSEWGLFLEPLNQLDPKVGIYPYDLNTPLFTDYASKLRFVRLPEGSSAKYHPSEVMDFPIETILIKNFFYPADMRVAGEERRIIETRLLIHQTSGWEALTYVWDDAQTDAALEVAGRTVPVSWTDESGELKKVNYSVPNLVQCKSCHELSAKMSPIGPSARQLNKGYQYASGFMNQLDFWAQQGILTHLPEENQRPQLPVWNDPKTGSIEQRSRAWLEANCAHCHRTEGPAKNTGLYLTYSEEDPYKLGVSKPPVAAGRGSGGLQYGIVPGEPQSSILLYRINSLDPGVMMPELGRKLRHEEGVELIREWIAGMD